VHQVPELEPLPAGTFVRMNHVEQNDQACSIAHRTSQWRGTSSSSRFRRILDFICCYLIELVLVQARNYFDWSKSSEDATLLGLSRLQREYPGKRHVTGYGVEMLRNNLIFGVGLLAQMRSHQGWKLIAETCQLFQELLQKPAVHLI
jgi:hypothetical protein